MTDARYIQMVGRLIRPDTLTERAEAIGSAPWSPDQSADLETLQTEQRAYENVMQVSHDDPLWLMAFVFGYLKDAVRHRTREEAQAIERGLSRALQEITS